MLFIAFFVLITALLRYVTHHAIHPFKVYNSIVLSIYAELGNHHPTHVTSASVVKGESTFIPLNMSGQGEHKRGTLELAFSQGICLPHGLS